MVEGSDGQYASWVEWAIGRRVLKVPCLGGGFKFQWIQSQIEERLKGEASMMDRSYKDLLKMQRFPHTWCPGCGIGAVMKNVAMVLKELGWNASEHGRRFRNRMFWKNGQLYESGRSPHPPWPGADSGRDDQDRTVLTSTSSSSQEMAIWQALEATISCIPHGEIPDITVFCNDNEIYGLTGGQAGPTTPKGTKTITSPRGEAYLPLRLGRLLTHQAPYFFARTSVYHLNHLKTCIREALQWKGFSFVDIVSDCIELNGRRLGFKTAHQMFKWFDERFHIVEGVRDHLKDDELGIAKAEATVEEAAKPVEKAARKS